jgi:hypothetical protein
VRWVVPRRIDHRIQFDRIHTFEHRPSQASPALLRRNAAWIAVGRRVGLPIEHGLLDRRDVAPNKLETSLAQGSGQADAVDRSADVGWAAIAGGSAKVFRNVVPAAAPYDMLRLGRAPGHPYRPVGRSILIGIVPAILDPLPDIAVHVVEAESIGCE